MRGIYNGQGFEQFLNCAHDVGEDMSIVESDNGSITIVNRQTGEWRQFTQGKGTLLVDDDEIDYDAMEKGCPHYHKQSREIRFQDLWVYDNFKDGIAALHWMIYPDGMYFADSDGYGMEDNDEENAYCIIDKHLNVIVPFQPMDNVRQVLTNTAKALKEKEQQ